MLHSYTMRFLDRAEFPVLSREFMAVDDGAAVSHALIFSKTHLIEIFQAGRLIARIPKGALGLGPGAGAGSQSEHAR